MIMHSKTHLICLAAGLRSDRLGGDFSTRETPALSNTERILKKVGQKVGDVLVVPDTFCLGRCPCVYTLI